MTFEIRLVENGYVYHRVGRLGDGGMQVFTSMDQVLAAVKADIVRALESGVWTEHPDSEPVKSAAYIVGLDGGEEVNVEHLAPSDSNEAR